MPQPLPPYKCNPADLRPQPHLVSHFWGWFWILGTSGEPHWHFLLWVIRLLLASLQTSYLHSFTGIISIYYKWPWNYHSICEPRIPLTWIEHPIQATWLGLRDAAMNLHVRWTAFRFWCAPVKFCITPCLFSPYSSYRMLDSSEIKKHTRYFDSPCKGKKAGLKGVRWVYGILGQNFPNSKDSQARWGTWTHTHSLPICLWVRLQCPELAKPGGTGASGVWAPRPLAVLVNFQTLQL